MNNQHRILKEKISQVYRRWRKVVIFKGASKSLIVTVAALLLVFLLDTIFQLGPTFLISLLVLVSVVSLAILYLSLIRPLWRAPSQNQIARYIEEKNPNLEDRLISALELGSATDPTVSAQILSKLLDDTRFHIEPLNLPKFVPAKAATAWGSFALATSVFLGAFVFSNLDFFTLKSNRIFTPWKIPTLKAVPSLQVTPGDARIPTGSPLEIKASINGFEAEQATLYFTSNDSAWTKLEMDQEATDSFVYNFFNVELASRYYVKIEDELSDIYQVSVYDAPKIKRVELTYSFPKYTGLKTKRERDGGDIWAPEGTTVRIRAFVDKPLKEGKIILGGTRELRTAIKADTILTASLKVTTDTFYRIHITDMDDLSNHLPPEYYIHALPDQPPVLTIEKPGRDIKASMIEEVPVRVHVEDDYGLSALRLVYTINEKPSQTLDLNITKPAKIQHDVELNEIQDFKASHMFYLEDFDVKPGDFLTFHVQVTDNHQSRVEEPITSEIFFIEVRPFEQSFFRPLSQGQSGGGGGRGPGRLSQTQKDIIVATWKTKQKKAVLTPEEFQESTDVIIESQSNLKEVTENTLFQMQQRSILSGRSNTVDISKHYSSALDAMERALEQLKNNQLGNALSPEKESLAELLAVEAYFNESQLQQSQGGGGGQAAALEELAQLFDEEMDNLKNKYETNQQNLNRQNEKANNEALDKIKELAKRQQQLNQRLRDLARKNLPPEEKKRRIEELRRQQEQMRQETNQLARQMQQQNRQNSGMPREMQDNLRRATSDMNNASNNMRQDNAELAAAKGQQALNRLKRMEELLERNQKQSLRRQFESLQERMQKMAEAQEKLTKDVEVMSKAGGKSEDKKTSESHKQEAQGEQERLKQEFGEIEKNVKSLARKTRKAKNEAAREIGEFSKELQQAEIKEKMAEAEEMLKEDRLNSAAQAGRDIQKMLEDMTEKFSKVRGAFAETEEEKLDVAMDQTKELRENLESLQRQMKELERKSERGSEQKELAGDPNSQRTQAGPQENRGPNQKLDPSKLDWRDELAKARRDLDFIQESASFDTSLSNQARRLSQSLDNMVRTFRGGDENRLKLIEAQVLIPLKSFEAELAQKLELIKNKEKLFLARDEEIPPEYEHLVEKYYEALSKTQGKRN
ncbi:hypothetical protein MJD09_17920 [bacterium]|nr:hypothetical protein [bacterium]